MRLVKMFGLAAIAAVAAMAFVGASSASATFNTQLCLEAHNVGTLTCGAEKGVKKVHLELTPGTVGVLVGKNPSITVLCLAALGLANIGALGTAPTPQSVSITSLTFGGCGTSVAHNECTIKSSATEGTPIKADLLKTGLNVGTLTGLDGTTNVVCKVFEIFKIDCTYSGAGVKFGVEGANGTEKNKFGMLNAAGTPLTKTAGGSLCPETSEITQGLLEPSQTLNPKEPAIYVKS